MRRVAEDDARRRSLQAEFLDVPIGSTNYTRGCASRGKRTAPSCARLQSCTVALRGLEKPREMGAGKFGFRGVKNGLPGTVGLLVAGLRALPFGMGLGAWDEGSSRGCSVARDESASGAGRVAGSMRPARSEEHWRLKAAASATLPVRSVDPRRLFDRLGDCGRGSRLPVLLVVFAQDAPHFADRFASLVDVGVAGRDEEFGSHAAVAGAGHSDDPVAFPFVDRIAAVADDRVHRHVRIHGKVVEGLEDLAPRFQKIDARGNPPPHLARKDSGVVGHELAMASLRLVFGRDETTADLADAAGGERRAAVRDGDEHDGANGGLRGEVELLLERIPHLGSGDDLRERAVRDRPPHAIPAAGDLGLGDQAAHAVPDQHHVIEGGVRPARPQLGQCGIQVLPAGWHACSSGQACDFCLGSGISAKIRSWSAALFNGWEEESD